MNIDDRFDILAPHGQEGPSEGQLLTLLLEAYLAADEMEIYRRG